MQWLIYINSSYSQCASGNVPPPAFLSLGIPASPALLLFFSLVPCPRGAVGARHDGLPRQFSPLLPVECHGLCLCEGFVVPLRYLLQSACSSLAFGGSLMYLFGRAVSSCHVPIYTIIFLKSVCQRSQTAGRNSCSIISGNVSNCSHRLTVYPVTSSRLNSA